MINKYKYHFIIILLFFFTLIIKVRLLSNVIPSQDQTSYIYWLQSLFNSQTFGPNIIYESLIEALQLDDQSFLLVETQCIRALFALFASYVNEYGSKMGLQLGHVAWSCS